MITLNPDNPKHAEALRRLREETIIWLTTVTASGQPQSTPLWFLWDGEEFLIYGSKDGPKTRNIERNPRVSLHLEGNGRGGGNVIFEGTARVDSDGPRADGVRPMSTSTSRSSTRTGGRRAASRPTTRT